MLAIFDGPRITLHSDRRWHWEPRWLSHENDHPFLTGRAKIRRYRSFWQYATRERPRLVCLRRTYALGDILMLLPVAAALHRRLELPEPIAIVVHERYYPQLRASNRRGGAFHFLRDRGIADYECDVHVNLDSALEADHRGGWQSDHHRIELYGKALGMEVRPA